MLSGVFDKVYKWSPQKLALQKQWNFKEVKIDKWLDLPYSFPLQTAVLE